MCAIVVLLILAIPRQRKTDDVDQPDHVEEKPGEEIATIAFLLGQLCRKNSVDDARDQTSGKPNVPIGSEERLKLTPSTRVHTRSPFLFYIIILLLAE